MRLLGLTGGYCAGKNRVAALLEKRGYKSIDVDRLGHLALSSSKEAIVARFDAEARMRFGAGIVDAEGRIDRRALGKIVFSDRRALADHEAIVHPAMFALLDELIAHLGQADGAEEELVVVINAAILYKMPIVTRCSAIIEVRAPLLQRLFRAATRDGLGAGAALARIRRQRDLWSRRENGSWPIFILRNSGTEAALEGKLEELLAKVELA